MIYSKEGLYYCILIFEAIILTFLTFPGDLSFYLMLSSLGPSVTLVLTRVWVFHILEKERRRTRSKTLN